MDAERGVGPSDFWPLPLREEPGASRPPVPLRMKDIVQGQIRRCGVEELEFCQLLLREELPPRPALTLHWTPGLLRAMLLRHVSSQAAQVVLTTCKHYQSRRLIAPPF